MCARRVAIDLGASSGRVAVGEIVAGRLEFEVIHRFPNQPVATAAGIKWEFESLLREILIGIKRAGEQGEVASIGVDSWAVDYGVIDAEGHLICTPFCYRDKRTEGILESLNDATKETFASKTGLQFLPFNTVFQLKAHSKNELKVGNQILMVPDLVHYHLTGIAGTEFTNASTTQLLDPSSNSWIPELAAWIPIPIQCLPKVYEAGTRVGKLKPEFQTLPGLSKTEVILPATHDTGSAVLAVPMESPTSSAYVSSGTWSLVGVETPHPVLTDSSRDAGFSNEGGAFGTTRLLKNMMGLWILQECSRSWGTKNWDSLINSAKPFLTTVDSFDPDLPQFLAPGKDMPDRVTDLTGLTTKPEITASILVSLAQKTAKLVKLAGEVAMTEIRKIYVVGGGSQNALLNQLIANESGLPVVAGPVEATLMGNLLVQFKAAGELGADSIRDVVRRSIQTETFEPGQ
ncbi:MAG: rhamnulokinase [Armatimonadetes bacterium]|nr:rhamnulokinase [Armatimonadota bacterium]